MSQSALSEILQEIKREGLPNATSRSSVKRARESELASWSNSIGDAITDLEFDCLDQKTKTKKPMVVFASLLRAVPGFHQVL